MSNFCQDRDLLSIEPVIFIGGGFPSQQLISGNDGVMAGTTFTSAGSDFATAGIATGMVLCTHTGAPAEGNAYEVVSVDSQTSLTVSVLRAEANAAATPPTPGTSLAFFVRTFQPQIHGVSETLAEKLRQISESGGIAQADFADSEQLRFTTAYGVLASVFVARAENATSADANWIKAEYYRREFTRLQTQLRLAVDIDGDGTAEATRTLGNVTLRRS